MKQKKYMVRWLSLSENGFGSPAAAQQYITSVCMTVAPDINYRIAEEF